MDNNTNNKSGFSFADDLLVDITGALFPGLLFLVILSVSVLIPLKIYDKSHLYEANQTGSLWWVLLVVILIVSYVIGHVFFRADILEPDKRDIRRRINEEIMKCRRRFRGKLAFDDVKGELRDQILAFKETLKDFEGYSQKKQKQVPEFYEILLTFCEEATRYEIQPSAEYPIAILKVLFPEEVIRIQRSTQKLGNDAITFDKFSQDIRQTMSKYRKAICSTDYDVPDEETLKLLVCSCMLAIQWEVGCINEINCSFPYMYYHKYLLRRNLFDYLDEVTWNADTSRSKNVINNYKIEIQMFAPEGYSLVRKNEAHIRMSSSTWHMAQPLKWISGTMAILMFFALLVNNDIIHVCPCNLGFGTTKYGAAIALILPLLVLGFLFYIQRHICMFIHYQRMREIFYTISIYDDYKDIIEDKKKVKDIQKNYHVNIYETIIS